MAQLSKLQVRFIQTQKSFFLQNDNDSKNSKLPLDNLYIKDSNSFYFANQSDVLDDKSMLTLLFKEKNDYLSTFTCKTTAHVIENGSDEYEDALLFFHQDPETIKQVLLLTVEDVEQK